MVDEEQKADTVSSCCLPVKARLVASAFEAAESEEDIHKVAAAFV